MFDVELESLDIFSSYSSSDEEVFVFEDVFEVFLELFEFELTFDELVVLEDSSSSGKFKSIAKHFVVNINSIEISIIKIVFVIFEILIPPLLLNI